MTTPTIDNLPEELDIKCAQGKTLRGRMRVVDSAGDPVDLSGGEVRGKVRKSFLSATVEATFAMTPDAQVTGSETTGIGWFAYLLTDTQTAAITCGEKITDKESQHVYDMEFEDSAGDVFGIARGKFPVQSEATR